MSCEHNTSCCLECNECTECALEAPSLRARVKALEAALEEACNEFAEASQYKGDFLRKKHGDDRTLKRLRAVLSGSTPHGGG